MKRFYRKLFTAILCAGFLLGIKDGYIALWKGEDPQPCRVFPMRADTLPVADQLRLHQGIHIDSLEQLMELMDDYL